ncbi:MAG: hypothetical protein KTR14_07900 [Vampirovibrio sp.]|nr:hypothetical protein [Vampirovibrio sp.]
MTSTRFGLKGDALKNHPFSNYKLELGKHLTKDAQGKLHPTQQLIEDVASLYLQAGNNDPKAIVIPDIARFIDNFEYKEGSKGFETAYAFQKELIDKAWEHVRKTRFPKASEKDFSTMHYIQDEREDFPAESHKFAPYGGRIDEWPQDPPRTKTTVKPYRKLGVGADNALLAYTLGPARNIEVENFKIMDFPHLLKDKHIPFHQAFQHMLRTRVAGHFLRETVEQNSDMNDYTLEVPLSASMDGEKPPTVPMVIMNGYKMAHKPAATVPDVSDFLPGQHQMAYQLSLARINRRSDFWQDTEKVPFLNYWYHTGKEPKV